MNLEELEKVKQKLKYIFPEVIGLVITKNRGKINLCPVNFQAISTAYESPLTICIGLSNESYSLKSILEKKEFIYAYPNSNQLRDTIYCGTVSGKNNSKLSNTSFKFIDSEIVDVPCLENGILNLECKLVHRENRGNFSVLIAEIIKIHPSVNDSLEKIYSFGGSRYGIIKEIEVLLEGRNF